MVYATKPNGNAPGLPQNKAKNHRRLNVIAIGLAVGGAIMGYGVGSLGGSVGEGWLWVVLLGVSVYFLTISEVGSTWRENCITLAFLSCQVGIFVIIGALLTWSTGDATGLPLCLKIGLLLTILTGIVNWQLSREMPGGFFFLLGLCIGIGAGLGALIAIMLNFIVWAGVAMGSMIALFLPYYFYQINARPIFLTFLISTLGGMQVIFAYGWSLLQGFYYTTAFTFIVALVLITIDYLQVHAWKKSRHNSLLPYLRI